MINNKHNLQKLYSSKEIGKIIFHFYHFFILSLDCLIYCLPKVQTAQRIVDNRRETLPPPGESRYVFSEALELTLPSKVWFAFGTFSSRAAYCLILLFHSSEFKHFMPILFVYLWPQVHMTNNRINEVMQIRQGVILTG